MGRSTRSISQRAAKRSGRWFLLLFFSIFFLVGSGLSYGFFVGPVLKIRDAENWTETPCVIVSSEVGVHRGSKSTTYSVQIVYSYRVNGQEYQSDRYSLFRGLVERLQRQRSRRQSLRARRASGLLRQPQRPDRSGA